ncbi:unnamed protein product [Sphagnum balticum]
MKIEKEPIKITIDKESAASLAKVVVLAGLRNTILENIHSGAWPVSKTGDFSDVKVVTPYGDIPWAETGDPKVNKLGRITPEEMRDLVKDSLNRVYTILLRLDDPEFVKKIGTYTANMTDAWDEPEFLADWNSGAWKKKLEEVKCQEREGIGWLLPVPDYYPNSDDNAGCLPASIQMVMSTQPGFVVPSINELDRIQEREPGKVVWAFKLSTELAKQGFDVIRYVGEFDVQHFVSLDKDSLHKQHGKEYLDIELIQRHAGEALTTRNLEIRKKIPTTNDIRVRINEGYYVVPCIDYKILHGGSADTGPGHFIVVYGYDKEGVYIRDPGKHPSANSDREMCHIPWERFERAWSPLSKDDRSMTCCRPKDGLRGAPAVALSGPR